MVIEQQCCDQVSLLLHFLVHVEAEQRALQLRVVGSVAVLLQAEEEVLLLGHEGDAVFQVLLVSHQELLGLFGLRRVGVVGERLLVVGAWLGKGLLSQLDLRGHLAGAHGELGELLESLAGRDLAFGAIAASEAGTVVMDDLKGAGRVGLRLHALEQIILIVQNWEGRRPGTCLSHPQCGQILQSFMNAYFSATEIHLEDRCLLDAADPDSAPVLATLGTENLIYRLNTADSSEERYNLSEGQFDALAISPDATHCLIGGKGNSLIRFDFADSSTSQLLETLGNITAIKYAPSSRYAAVGSEEGKTIIYEPSTGKKEKCRPGHTGAVCSIAISKSGNLLASIGRDQNLLIYRIELDQQPVEVARYQITRLEDCLDLTCSFHPSEQTLFSSGSTHLQRLQCVQNRWEHSTSELIFHNREIIMAQVVKPNTIVTSSLDEVCIWSIRQEEKLFVIEDFNLLRVVPLKGRFFGTRNDGKMYEYQRELREEEPMDIEHQSAVEEDEIRFDQEEPQREDAQEQREIDYHQHKKTKADKMIKVYPQPAISNATQPFEGSRFLFVNSYGCVIERQQADEDSTIEVELNTGGKEQRLTLGRSKGYSVFAINEMGVVFASDKEVGFRPSSRNNTEEWLLELPGVEAVAMGAGWIAVATDSSLRIFDIASHQIRSISFDRPIVALRAYENILAVVYHQSVPLWQAQQLAMQHFFINCFRSQVAAISNTHVPIKRTALLHWLDFSKEGMLFSQDSTGEIRAFSMETNEWTSVYPDVADSTGKFWIIGIDNYRLIYWKITKTDPEPTVAPRFQPRESEFSVATVGSYPEGTQETYEKLLWRRYVLDHQKARTRLWGSLKIKRAQSNLFFRLSASIMSEKEVARRHCELDEKYFALIEKYLKAKEHFRAIFMAQNCIRSEEAARRLVELFDFENQRSLAIQFQEHCDQMQKEADYQKMQIFSFMKLREQAEKSIKPRSEDPMKRGISKKPAEALPSFSQSFLMSQQSVDRSELNTSNLSNAQNLQSQNPFLRRKSNHESLQAKKKEISEQIQRFGIKQKVDKRAIGRPNK